MVPVVVSHSADSAADKELVGYVEDAINAGLPPAPLLKFRFADAPRLIWTLCTGRRASQREGSGRLPLSAPPFSMSPQTTHIHPVRPKFW
jgi:hypothetical protein